MRCKVPSVSPFFIVTLVHVNLCLHTVVLWSSVQYRWYIISHAQKTFWWRSCKLIRFRLKLFGWVLVCACFEAKGPTHGVRSKWMKLFADRICEIFVLWKPWFVAVRINRNRAVWNGRRASVKPAGSSKAFKWKCISKLEKVYQKWSNYELAIGRAKKEDRFE